MSTKGDHRRLTEQLKGCKNFFNVKFKIVILNKPKTGIWVTDRGGDCLRLSGSWDIREIMEKMGIGICPNFHQPLLARTPCDDGGQDSGRSFTKRRN